MSRRVFVYGTFRSDVTPRHPRAQIITQNLNLEGPAKMPGRLYNIGAFPGAIYGTDGPGVVGQVWIGDHLTTDEWDQLIDRLDAIEGHPRLFERTQVRLEDGTEVITYLYNNINHLTEDVLIESGDWEDAA